MTSIAPVPDSPTAVAPPPSPAAAPVPRAAAKPKRLPALDGFRFVAAILVVCFHLSSMWFLWDKSPADVLPRDYVRFTSYGWLGVELFFMISGFVICMSSWGRGISQYFTSRVVRLYPAYWCGVIITSAVTLYFGGATSSPTKWDRLVNLTMLQEPMGVTYVDSVYWTLWVELRFYLLFAVVVWMGTTYRRVVAFCVIWTTAGILSVATDSKALQYVLAPNTTPFFVAGIAFYLMYRYKQNLLLWGIVGFSFVLAEHNVIERHRIVEHDIRRHLAEWPTHFVVAVFFVIMAGLALGWFNRLDFRWFTNLGTLTYPLYLLHCEIGWTIIIHFRDRVSPGVLVASLTASSLVAAWLVHNLVEKRLGPRLNKALKNTMATLPRN
ncbi:acyltransferase family protein [Kitasatospora sp. NPDC058162]|uniref:acyltransferase family protein n=1 Tax=Kitasatospora sp. NPDC058162 TaxID=3346362 RepID=UPI0036DB92D0